MKYIFVGTLKQLRKLPASSMKNVFIQEYLLCCSQYWGKLCTQYIERTGKQGVKLDESVNIGQ